MNIMVVVEDQGVLNHRFAKKLSSEQIQGPTLRITIIWSILLPRYVTIDKDKWFERLREANIHSFLFILPTVVCYENLWHRKCLPARINMFIHVINIQNNHTFIQFGKWQDKLYTGNSIWIHCSIIFH